MQMSCWHWWHVTETRQHCVLCCQFPRFPQVKVQLQPEAKAQLGA